MPAAPHIGTRIKKRRQVLRMTQGDLAAKLDVSKSTVANWERGKHFPLRYLGALEDVLGVQLDDAPAPEPDLVPTDEWEASVLEDEYLPDDEKRWLVTQSREARLAYVAARRARREQDAAAESARSGHGKTAG